MDENTIRALLEARAFAGARIAARGGHLLCVEISTVDGWRLAEDGSGRPRVWRSIDAAADWLRRLGVGDIQVSFGERALHRAVGRQPLHFSFSNGSRVVIDQFHVIGTYLGVLAGAPKGNGMDEQLERTVDWAKTLLPKSPKPVLIPPETMQSHDPFRYLPPLSFCANFVSGFKLNAIGCGTHASLIWFGDEDSPTPAVDHARRLFERVTWEEVAESFDY